jgi:hypothetical protein
MGPHRKAIEVVGDGGPACLDKCVKRPHVGLFTTECGAVGDALQHLGREHQRTPRRLITARCRCCRRQGRPKPVRCWLHQRRAEEAQKQEPAYKPPLRQGE